MYYSGSKQGIAQAILFRIKKNIGDYTYVEPFLGGANVMSAFATDNRRIGNDYNTYVIELWRALQQGWTPPEFVSEDEYNEVKANKSCFDPKLVGYIGTVCSFLGYWFEGYAGKSKHVLARNGRVQIQDMQQVQRRNMMSQVSGMHGVELQSTDYREMHIPAMSVVYCDPPYAGVAYHYLESNFSHPEFWSWCIDLVNKGRKVFVTERTAPESFVSIWTKKPHFRQGVIRSGEKPDNIFVHRDQVSILDTEPPSTPKLRLPS